MLAFEELQPGTIQVQQLACESNNAHAGRAAHCCAVPRISHSTALHATGSLHKLSLQRVAARKCAGFDTWKEVFGPHMFAPHVHTAFCAGNLIRVLMGVLLMDDKKLCLVLEIEEDGDNNNNTDFSAAKKLDDHVGNFVTVSSGTKHC